MIFIGLFLFIALIVISLNMYDSHNLDKIEQYIKAQKCEAPIYSKGSYKSFCDDKILEVSNSFIVDLQENSKEYMYKDIKSIKKDKLNIVINDKEVLRFKEQKNLDTFYESLEKKIKN